MGALAALGPWAWLVAGLVLIGLETVAPGVFLVWLGIAAILTGIVDWALAPSWQANLVIFAVLAGLAVAGGRTLTRRQGDVESDAPNLNRRGAALVGRTFTLEAAIAGGEGRVRVDDSSWRAIGPDCPAGTAVRVIRVEGATLIVEAAG